MSRLVFPISLGKGKICRAGRATECRGAPVNIWFYWSIFVKFGIRICCYEIVNQAHLLHHFDNCFLPDKNLTCSHQRLVENLIILFPEVVVSSVEVVAAFKSHRFPIRKDRFLCTSVA